MTAQLHQDAGHSLFDNLLTVKQLALQLGVSVAFIYVLMKDEGLPYFKLGRATRFRVQEVSAWLSKRRKP